ncbi:MAG TPA: rubredoxin [Rhizomicrobium sp.]
MAAYKCPDCGFVYDETRGFPREGVAPGTPWQKLPDDWPCPDCLVCEKTDFQPLTGEA